MYSQTLSSVLPYLNYDIQSCQVAVLLGSDNPEDKKRHAKQKVNKYQQMCSVYSSQYIVFSLTARHTGEVYCVLSLVILKQRAAAPDRTNGSDGSDDSGR